MGEVCLHRSGDYSKTCIHEHNTSSLHPQSLSSLQRWQDTRDTIPIERREVSFNFVLYKILIDHQ